MITVDIRGDDPHHYYRVTAHDAAQLERIKTYIRHRIAAGDPDLVRGPGIDGARISTQRRASRSARPDQPTQPNSTPRSAPHATAVRRYGSLAAEGGKRGAVDTVAFAADVGRRLTPFATYDHLMANAPPEVQAAYRASYPGWGDYIQRKAEQLGITHPDIKPNNTAERYVLEGSRIIGASVVPIGGWEAAGARTLARVGAGAVKLVAGAGASVGGGDLAEHLRLPRIVGELPAFALGASGTGAVARGLREEVLDQAALRAVSREEAYRGVKSADFAQDAAHWAEMGRLMSMEQRLRGNRKLRLDGLVMADTVPRLLNPMTGDDLLFLKGAGLDDIATFKAPRDMQPWSLRQFVDSALADRRYKTAVRLHGRSLEQLFLRQHPELAQHIRVINRGRIEPPSKRAPYPAESPVPSFERLGRHSPMPFEPDYSGYPIELTPLPPQPLHGLTATARKKGRAVADALNGRIHDVLGTHDTQIQYHDITPIEWGGDPSNPANRIPLSKADHQKIVNSWWGKGRAAWRRRYDP